MSNVDSKYGHYVFIYYYCITTAATTTTVTTAAPINKSKLAKVSSVIVVEKGNLMGLLLVKWGIINASKHLESDHSEGRKKDGMIKSNIS